MKRNIEGECVAGASTTRESKTNSYWKNALKLSLKDASLHVDKTDLAVMIKDKYPKAEHHYLILPKEEIEDLKSLKQSHIPLLKHLHQFANTHIKRITEEEPNTKFKIGYHAVPSMSYLHLHVISQDFNSPHLKNKKHWNSFTTEFFIPAEDVLKDLENHGKAQIDVERTKNLLKNPLKCHVCKMDLPNMPRLKRHIVTHRK